MRNKQALRLQHPLDAENPRDVKLQLYKHYQAKADAVGLSLSEYCRRFGIRKSWE